MRGPILVTGAGGFVGRHLLPALAGRFPGAAVVAAGFDVTDAAAVAAGIAEVRPEALVHLAAVAAPGEARQDPARAWAVNLHGALHVARGVLAAAPGCVLLFAGSADAYGASFRAGRAVDEDVPLAPQNVYGATKAAADLALGAMVGDGLRLLRARPFNHTGPGQSDAYVVAAFARQVVRIGAGQQAPVLEVGALAPERDFSDVRDICAAYAAMLAAGLEGRLAPGAILNLASGVPRRVGSVLERLMQLAGVEAEVRTAQERLRPGDIARAEGDAGRARAALGWAPRIGWDETLRDVLADWRQRIQQPSASAASRK